MKTSLTWGGDDTHAPIRLSPDEHEALIASDPVMVFYRRVCDSAVAKPYFAEDFRRATHDAFGEAYRDYVIEKLKERSDSTSQ